MTPINIAHSERDNNRIVLVEDQSNVIIVDGDMAAKMWHRLEDLGKLCAGWDGPDSKAISSNAINCMKDVLRNVKDEQLRHWILFPDGRGFLYLDYTKDDLSAGISLEDKAIKYFAMRGMEIVDKSDAMDLNADNVLRILEEIYVG